MPPTSIWGSTRSSPRITRSPRSSWTSAAERHLYGPRPLRPGPRSGLEELQHRRQPAGRFKYGYNSAGDVQWKQNVAADNAELQFDESYTYNDLGGLTSDQRGPLTSDGHGGKVVNGGTTIYSAAPDASGRPPTSMRTRPPAAPTTTPGISRSTAQTRMPMTPGTGWSRSAIPRPQ